MNVNDTGEQLYSQHKNINHEANPQNKNLEQNRSQQIQVFHIC